MGFWFVLRLVLIDVEKFETSRDQGEEEEEVSWEVTEEVMIELFEWNRPIMIYVNKFRKRPTDIEREIISQERDQLILNVK